jgi:5-methylcytosine-specific restriction endonuclease McrA
MSRPSAALVVEVRRRARGRCEYCHFPETHAVIPFEVEHVIAEKHGGATETSNLAFACFYCNRYKGPNIAGLQNPVGW